MNVDVRYKRLDDGRTVPRGLILTAETTEESKMIDECCGSEVGHDGLIAVMDDVRVKLSDGYGDHYIYIPAKEAR